MSEIARPCADVPATADDLHDWIYVAGKTHQIATSLAKTSFVPKTMQGRPDEITGAILAGRELGLSPMASLRSIDIIDGTPAIRAVTLRALVQAQGHEVWVEESTALKAVVHARRKGEEHVQTSVWTMERAKQAGLASKKNWQSHPAAMLVARATAEVCRLIAADVLLGMPYSSEEVRDGVVYNIDTGQPEQVVVDKPKTPTRTFRRIPPDHPINQPPDLGAEALPDALPAADEVRQLDAAPAEPDDAWPEVAEPAR